MTRQQREVIADWLILIGAAVLFVSLFLTWSHQFSAPFLVEFGASDVLNGVPHNPTAWQVYSSADVLLALLAVGLAAAAMFGNRQARALALLLALAALVFVVHALAVPPTNGANVFNPSLSVPDYFPNSPAAGIGETIALLALVTAACGLLLSFTAE